MSLVVTFDWKCIVALGLSAIGIIFAVKMEPDAAERVSTNAVDAFKEFGTVVNGN